jgi:hypothetical protein
VISIVAAARQLPYVRLSSLTVRLESLTYSRRLEAAATTQARTSARLFNPSLNEAVNEALSASR